MSCRRWVLVNCRNVNLCQIEPTEYLMSSLLTQPLQSNGTLYHNPSPWIDSSTESKIKDQSVTVSELWADHSQVPQHSLSSTRLIHMLSCSPISHYFSPACTVFSHYHFLILSHSLTITFLPHLLVDLTRIFHLVPFSLTVFTKSLGMFICCVLGWPVQYLAGGVVTWFPH